MFHVFAGYKKIMGIKNFIFCNNNLFDSMVMIIHDISNFFYVNYGVYFCNQNYIAIIF
jgi:hypothetical protein